MATVAELQAEIARRQQSKGITQQEVQAEIARRQQAEQQPVQTPVQPAQQPQIDPSILAQAPEFQRRQQAETERRQRLETIGGIVEPVAALATGAVAEPVAGLAGLAVLPFEGPEAAARTVEETRQALTLQPVTETGQQRLQAVGEAIEPVSKAIEATEEFTGDVGFAVAGPIGGAIGKALPTAALSALGIRRKPGAAPDISEQRGREIQSALEASQRTGVDVLTSDIFQPKSILSRLSQQFSERVPLLGVGGKRGAQQQQRIDALEDLNQSIPRIEAADVFDGLQASANRTRVAAGKRLNDVIEQMNPNGQVGVDSTLERIDAALAKQQRTGKLESPELIADLENLKQTAQEAGQSFESLREFRTDARAIADKVDPSGRSQLRSSDKASMDSVIDGITEDLDGFVLANSDGRTLARYKKADQIYAQEAATLTKSRLKTVLDRGDVKPELINNLLFSSAPSEVKLLFKSLDSTGRQNAKMSLYRRALDNATRQGEVSPQRFASELDKLGSNFNTFFRGESRAELNGLKKLLETTKRAGETGVVTPTGQALQIPATTAVLAGAAVGQPAAIATLLGASTIGLAARAYESAGVRNMLIRLGKAKKRSTLEADLQRSIPILLAEANRGIEREQQAVQSPSAEPQSNQVQ